MKLEFGDKKITVANVIYNLSDNCDEALTLFKDWYLKCHLAHTSQQLTLEWLEENETAAKWAIEKGFVKEGTPKHDWSGLELQFEDDGEVTLINNLTGGMCLIEFLLTGEVNRIKYAGNKENYQKQAGNFDKEGKLIIT